MNATAHWNLDLLDALSFEAKFTAAQLVPPSIQDAECVRPQPDEIARAVANIRVWRTYLPPICVSRMIEDGWQWST